MSLFVPPSRGTWRHLVRTLSSVCQQTSSRRSTVLASPITQGRPMITRSLANWTQHRDPTLPQVACTSPIVQLVYRSHRPFSQSTVAASPAVSSSPSTSDVSASEQKKSRSSSSFPEVTESRAVALWLLASAVSVFGIVVWGGLTRLTESGLSITEWRPVTGSFYPRTHEAWTEEFEKYRASPEFQVLNPHMTLEEFQKIYFMEWSHRLWGRFIGVAFVLPAVYFVARRRVSKSMAWNLLGISSLIGFEGAIGWWMVKSGLKDDLFAPGSHPRVSQYRLTAHLATAFACYSWMMVSALSVFRTRRLLANPSAGIQLLGQLQHPALLHLRRLVTGLTALVFTTAMSGALVAGLDAGLIYNEFPYMGQGLSPPAAELWDEFYARRDDKADLWWRNMLENPSTVQLNHRILAMTTLTSILSLFVYFRRGRASAVATPAIRKGVSGLVHLVLLQVSLGLATLLYFVPTHVAATHQAGSLALLTGALVLGQRLHIPPSMTAVLRRQMEAASKSGAKSVPNFVSTTNPVKPRS